MNIAITGASGFIGRALVPVLRSAGHDVKRFVRRPESAADEISWDPAARRLDPERLEGIDAVINLAGENIGAGRWTAARRERILRSRVDATNTVVTALAKLRQKPAVFISASAVGLYGDRGDEELTESAEIGHGFLPEVCLAWETHAEGAARLGIRSVLLRFGVVLAADGGALGKMLPIFRWGFGGRLGSGQQWMSWISREDVIGIIQRSLIDSAISGPINLVAPEPVTNAEFTRALGRALHRPTLVPVPTWALKLLFGRMADEALLASTRAVPARLEALGYEFQHRSIDEALTSALRRL